MMKALLTTAALTVSAAALAAPAQAANATAATAATADSGDRWTATDTAGCAADLAVAPVLKAASPLPLGEAAPACGKGSLIQHGG
ncbi:hypothetical protein [Streptomyces sp. NPDC048242]|uniref:hypothetical protein n=1 Tax=Streptomyces sp. NPDC048242 TaxID=3155026 RepID=UPI00343E533C